MNRMVLPLTTLSLFATCVRPADPRIEQEQEVGIVETESWSLNVVSQQAAIRHTTQTKVVLWAQSPVLEIEISSKQASSFTLEVLNCMPAAVAVLRKGGPPETVYAAKNSPTHCSFELPLNRGIQNIHIAPPDWSAPTPFIFADMGDIQTAMADVHEVFETISREPDVRFVMSTGDITEDGRLSEYELFEEQLTYLDVPFFSTIGNHELKGDIGHWHRRYGRYNVHFQFKDVFFSYLDSGNATFPVTLYEQLDTWLEHGKEHLHVFGTHYPLVDPVGARDGGFRSRNEAYKILSKLAGGNIDLTLYGHIHSYYSFENAGIPAYISGGGGARPERLDGIDRHFLVIQASEQGFQVQRRSVE